jgi:transcription elongation factor Elf1
MGDRPLRLSSIAPSMRVAEAPPVVVLSESGTRFLCGYCGTLLVIAAPEQMTQAVVLCRNCGRHNELGS